jgi:hypothetical protein
MVVATPGLGGASRIVLRSVADKVVRGANVPVLVVAYGPPRAAQVGRSQCRDRCGLTILSVRAACPVTRSCRMRLILPSEPSCWTHRDPGLVPRPGLGCSTEAIRRAQAP